MENEQKNNLDVTHEEEMMERGKFIANGHTFFVKPVYLNEVAIYLTEVNISPVPNLKEEEINDKELSRFAVTLFSENLNGEQVSKKKGIIRRLYDFLFHRNDYHFYKEYTAVYPIIKWIERKVYCDGKNIRFFDLERKYGLTKSEIQRLIMFFHQISFF